MICFDAKSELILDGLRNRREGWNGGNVDAPNPESIERARKWLRSMYADAVTSNTTWIDPHVSSNEDGNVTFEWWNGDKKLTVYVSPEESWYIKVWGADVVNEMSDGTAESMEERQDAWQWLMGTRSAVVCASWASLPRRR
jgi:hypothetical protein